MRLCSWHSGHYNRLRRYSASHAWPCPKTIPSPTLCIIFAFSLHLGFAFLLPCHVGLHWSLHCFLHCHVSLHFQLSFFLHCQVGFHCPLHFYSCILSRQLVCISVLQFAPYTATMHIPHTGSYRPKASKTFRYGAAGGWAASSIGFQGPVNGPSQGPSQGVSQGVSQGKCKKNANQQRFHQKMQTSMQSSSDTTRKCKKNAKDNARQNAKKCKENATEMQKCSKFQENHFFAFFCIFCIFCIFFFIFFALALWFAFFLHVLSGFSLGGLLGGPSEVRRNPVNPAAPPQQVLEGGWGY